MRMLRPSRPRSLPIITLAISTQEMLHATLTTLNRLPVDRIRARFASRAAIRRLEILDDSVNRYYDDGCDDREDEVEKWFECVVDQPVDP